jgi:hypothetical protein
MGGYFLSPPLSHWFKLILKSTCLLAVSQLVDVLSFRTWRIRSRRFSCNYTCFLQGLLVLRFGSVIHALHGEQDMQNGWLKGNDNYIYNLLISSLAISGIPPFFRTRDEILLVAFEHNKILWFIASLASLMTAFYM